MTLDAFELLLKTVTPNVFHCEADERTKPPYIVWHEWRKVHDYADNRPIAGLWRIQVDFFSAKKRDPIADEIEILLLSSDIPYERSHWYDPEGKLMRYLFEIELLI